MPENVKIHEVLVVGGGPAGSALAAILAQDGRDVLLLEREKEPHHKVCGEFLSEEAIRYLNLLGIDPKLLGALKIEDLRLIDGARCTECRLLRPGLSLSRRTLDETLLNCAAQSGAKVKRGYNVKKLFWTGEAWEADIPKRRPVYGRTVFLACGKSDLRGWQRTDKYSDLIGFKMYFRLAPQQQRDLENYVEIIFLDGGYAGLELVDGGFANLCFLIQKKFYKKCGKDWKTLLLCLEEKCPHLARRLKNAQPLWKSPESIYRIPYGYIAQAPEQPGLFRLGDQAAVIHSFAGDGLAMALHSAFLAANTYLRGKGPADYNAEIRHSFSRPIQNAQYIAGLALNPVTKRLFAPVLRAPPVLPKIFHATRWG